MGDAGLIVCDAHAKAAFEDQASPGIRHQKFVPATPERRCLLWL